MEISIVIPTRDRKHALEKCLSSLLEQSLSKDEYEIIVIDDGSTDDTKPLLDSLKCSNEVLKYFKQENKGRGPARNLGIKNANGSIVAFIDDDCIADRCLLENALKYFNESEIGIVKGKVISKGAETTPLTRTVVSMSKKDTHTCNIFYLKKALDEVGGFKLTQFREDTDLAWRVLDAGYKRTFAPDSIVIHTPGQYDIIQLIKKHLSLKKPFWDIYLAKNFPKRYKKDIAAFGFFSPDLIMYYPVYLSALVTIIVFLKSPIMGFICLAFSLYVYITSVIIQTNELCRGTTFRQLFKYKKQMIQLIATWWFVMLSDLFFHICGMIRFKKFSL